MSDPDRPFIGTDTFRAVKAIASIGLTVEQAYFIHSVWDELKVYENDADALLNFQRRASDVLRALANTNFERQNPDALEHQSLCAAALCVLIRRVAAERRAQQADANPEVNDHG